MRSELKVSKQNIEIFITVLIFFISCLNYIGLYFAIICSLLFLLQGTNGIVKLMFLYILRTVISPGLFFDIDQYSIFQIFKWIIIFGGSCILITNSIYKKVKLDLLFYLIVILFIYLILSSYFYSNNGTLAVFKIINYILPLFALYFARNRMNKQLLINWFNKLLMLSIIVSVPLLNNPIGFLRNGHGFQGIYNHPNMFGIIGVLSLGVLFSTRMRGPYKIILSILYLLMVYESESRTSTISIFVLIIMFLFTSDIKILSKLYIFLAGCLSIIIISLTPFKENIISFIQKGQQINEIFYSRIGQIETFKIGFERSPFFGNGFGIPIQINQYIIKNTTIVEAGNLILAIIMYSGIFGLVIFLCILFYWFRNIANKYIYLFISTLLINMGEMVLFSSNSLGLWCSLFWVLSLDENKNISLKSDKTYV